MVKSGYASGTAASSEVTIASTGLVASGVVDLVGRLCAAVRANDVVEALRVNEQLRDEVVAVRGRLLHVAHLQGIGWSGIGAGFGDDTARLFARLQAAEGYRPSLSHSGHRG